MKQFSSRLGAVALALVVVIATFAIALPVSAQDSTVTEIDSCTTITEPGTYVLTEDITNSDEDACIDIRADDVVFDGNGHTIDGVDAGESTGVLAYGFDASDEDIGGIAVRDVTVTDWHTGISFESVSGTVTGVTATSNVAGINFEYSSGTVTGVTATSNVGGMAFDESGHITVTDSVANDNGGGILFYVSGPSTIRNVTANDNVDDGLTFADDGGYDVRDVTANGNGDAGFSLDGSSSNTFVDVTANDNARGFDLSNLERDTADNRIENATARGNTEWAYDSRVKSSGDDTNVVEHLDTGSATVSFVEDGIGVASVDDAPADPEGLANVDQYANVSDRGRNGDSEITLDVFYDESTVEDAGVDESSLALYRFVDDEWENVPNSAVDTDSNTVSATFDASQDPATDSLFGLFGRTDGDATDGEDGADNDNATDANASDDGMAGGDKSDDKHGDNAGDADDSNDDDIVDVGAKDIAIDLGDVTIADFELDGPGLSDEHIDHRTYSVGGFDIAIKGISFTIGNTDYRFCHVTIDVEPFDVVLDNVTVGNGE